MSGYDTTALLLGMLMLRCRGLQTPCAHAMQYHHTHCSCACCVGPTCCARRVCPQEVSIIDVRKEINFCRKVGMRVLGVVENMSGLQQRVPELKFSYAPSAQGEADGGVAEGEDVTARVMEALRAQFPDLGRLMVHAEVFPPSKGGAARMCGDMGVALLGRVPLDPALTRAAESGASIFEPLQQQQQQGGAGGAGAEGGQAVCLPALKAIVGAIKKQLGEE